MSWDWDKLREKQERRGDSPPQFDDLARKINDFKPPPGIHFVIAGLILAGMLLYTMFYTVGVDEEGVVTRFGKYHDTTKPGLNIKAPAGIDTVQLVRVRHIYKKEFGSRISRSTSGQRYVSGGEEDHVALMLTGDLNVAVVPWIVNYKIKDSYGYLFNVNDPEGLLGDLAEASMRLVVGDKTIDEVITKRMIIAEESKKILQKELDDAKVGIEISTIEMGKTNVPPKVQPSFNEVNQAVQEKETMILQAREEYNKAIPAAKGEKQRTIRDAEGYAMDRVNRARGDVSRFLALYHEYEKAKDVTKRRLYLETIKTLLPKLGEKYIIDSDQKNILPLLNLQKGKGILQ